MKIGEAARGVCMWDIIEPHPTTLCLRAKASGSCLLVVEYSYEGGEGGGSGWAWERKFTLEMKDLSFYLTYVAFST